MAGLLSMMNWPDEAIPDVPLASKGDETDAGVSCPRSCVLVLLLLAIEEKPSQGGGEWTKEGLQEELSDCVVIT